MDSFRKNNLHEEFQNSMTLLSHMPEGTNSIPTFWATIGSNYQLRVHFLDQYFYKGYKFNTISGISSAISAYHDTLDAINVGCWILTTESTQLIQPNYPIYPTFWHKNQQFGYHQFTFLILKNYLNIDLVTYSIFAKISRIKEREI